MMKKSRVRIAFLLVIMLVLSSMSFVITNAEPKLSVVVDGKTISFDAAPFVDANSRTQVPLRFIAEQMGAEVIWEENGKANTVTIKKNGTTIELKIGEKSALVNGIAKAFDTSCFLKEGRTFVPVRFVSEVLGAGIAWNAQSYTVTINTDGTTPQTPTPQTPTTGSQGTLTYPIVDTGTTAFYSDLAVISKPAENAAFYGQDAHYQINTPSYTDNKDGTITDNVTGLVWQQDMGEKISFDDAFKKAETLNLGGYDDWRVPTIKELYSLIQFTGTCMGEKVGKPFIDTNYFKHPIGNTSIGEREIDAQTWSATEYVGKTMNKDATVFGVNFVDGRIKGYGKYNPRTQQPNKMYFRMVRGNTQYGQNNFVDNGDGTISDLATGLMWQKADAGVGMDWKASLAYGANLDLAGKSDWRLPSAKELQSLVDYTRSLQTTNSPAINPMFETTKIADPNGRANYPLFWSSTTHLDGQNPNVNGVYVAFGEAQGKMNGILMDVHGAGAQRSDPKSGDASKYPSFFGPQGDVRYVYNYVRCVRSIAE